MGYDLNKKLVIAISSRALFNLEDENKIFEEKGLDEYYKYQIENEDLLPKKGTGFRLVKNLLRINEDFSEIEFFRRNLPLPITERVPFTSNIAFG